METDPKLLWRDKPIFSSNEMVEFAQSMAVNIMSSIGAHKVTVDDLGAWVKKKRMQKQQRASA